MSLEKMTDNKIRQEHIKKTQDINSFFRIDHEQLTQIETSQEYYYYGLYCLYKNNLIEAKKHLIRVINSADKVDSLYWKSLSFLGLVEVFLYKSNGGLHRCYEAKKEHSDIIDIHLNIAYAEYKLGNRKRCVNAIKYCLELEPQNKLAQNFFECIGRRTRKDFIKNVFWKFVRGTDKNSCKENLHHQIQNHLSIKLNNYVKKIKYQN